MPIAEKMMRLIGMALFENSEKKDISFSEEELGQMFSLADKHDIATIVGYSMQLLGILPENEIGKKFKDKIAESYFRFVRQQKAMEQVSTQYQEDKIDFVPLKGAVIRYLYPEPCLRTSCDVDILVRKKDYDRAIDSIEKIKGYKRSHPKTNHDLTVFADSGMHVEIHYDLMDKSQNIIATPWKYVIREDNSKYGLDKEYAYCYHIAHMAKHFQCGGCGIRPLIDLMFIKRKCIFDNEKLNSMLVECGVLSFEKQIVSLTEKLFFGNELSEFEKQVYDYIAFGGVYGNMTNFRRVMQTQDSRIKYVLSRIWIPYEELTVEYQPRKVSKIFVPFLQVSRWIKCIKRGRGNERMREVTHALTDSKKKIKDIKSMLEKLEIK